MFFKKIINKENINIINLFNDEMGAFIIKSFGFSECFLIATPIKKVFSLSTLDQGLDASSTILHMNPENPTFVLGIPNNAKKVAACKILTPQKYGDYFLVNHEFGQTPGAIFLKSTNTPSDWYVRTDFLDYKKVLKLTCEPARESNTFMSEPLNMMNFKINPESDIKGSIFGICFGRKNAFIWSDKYEGNESRDLVFDCGFEIGVIIIKNVSRHGSWFLYSPDLGEGNSFRLNAALPVTNEFAGDLILEGETFRIPKTSRFNIKGDTYMFIALNTTAK